MPETGLADDEIWQRRLFEGDRSAFDELYRRYGKIAYGLAVRITGDVTLAQDVVHDSFLALWRSPESYDPERGSFRAFFMALVHHRAVDIVRREARLRSRTERAANLEPVVGEDVADDVTDEAFLAVRSTEVREALKRLSPEQQQVLEMAYFDGMTQARIAAELGIPLGTVKTRSFTALRKLRDMLGEAD